VSSDGSPAADPAEGLAADPAAGLRAVLALRRLAERVEAEQVALARDQGWSWQQIADVLGMTRQSVHAKYGGTP
jgi:DNA-directed RNA polymerase specialized sigma24 family protein